MGNRLTFGPRTKANRIGVVSRNLTPVLAVPAACFGWLSHPIPYVRICHAVATTAGTCPFPMALSRCDRWATPSATRPNSGSTSHGRLDSIYTRPSELSRLLLVGLLMVSLWCLLICRRKSSASETSGPPLQARLRTFLSSPSDCSSRLPLALATSTDEGFGR